MSTTTTTTRSRQATTNRRDIPINAADLALAAETLRTASQDDTTTRSLARVANWLERESNRKSEKERILYSRRHRAR